MKSPQTVLVTGGLGFVGRSLCRALVRRGDRVRIVDNVSRGSLDFAEDLQQSCLIYSGDVRDEELILKASEGCDRIYHLAAINGTKNFYNRPRDVFDVGVSGTMNIVRIAERLGIREFILMSSSEAYQTPAVLPTPEDVALVVPDLGNARYSYGGSKIVGELLMAYMGRYIFDKAIIIRPHNVYGPQMGFDHVIPELAKKILMRAARAHGGKVQLPLEGGGRTTRAFVFIDDFIDGTLLASDEGQGLEVFHVGTEEEIFIYDLAEKIASHLGYEVEFELEEGPAGGTSRRCPSIQKLKKMGYSPKIDIDQGLPMALEGIQELVSAQT